MRFTDSSDAKRVCRAMAVEWLLAHSKPATQVKALVLAGPEGGDIRELLQRGVLGSNIVALDTDEESLRDASELFLGSGVRFIGEDVFAYRVPPGQPRFDIAILDFPVSGLTDQYSPKRVATLLRDICTPRATVMCAWYAARGLELTDDEVNWGMESVLGRRKDLPFVCRYFPMTYFGFPLNARRPGERVREDLKPGMHDIRPRQAKKNTCLRCNEQKPISEFAKYAGKKKREPRCKECVRIQQRANRVKQRANEPEHCRALALSWKESHQKKMQDPEYREKTRERARKLQRRKMEDPEYRENMRVKQRAWFLEKMQDPEYREKYREKMQARLQDPEYRKRKRVEARRRKETKVAKCA